VQKAERRFTGVVDLAQTRSFGDARQSSLGKEVKIR